ncbi:hypothetical protein BH23GEM2_BH23GEM2_08100 [soil metagenome]
MHTPGKIAELERKFAENPRRYFAALANEFRKQGELERAIELCEAHLAEQRNHLSGHVVLAQALVDAGRESDAWDPLHTALDLDPENFIALRLIGELFARVGDVDQARAYFFRALEIEPRNEQLLAAVKNLSQRPAPAPKLAEAERPERTRAQADAADSWEAMISLPGREPTTAFDAEAAAEPVADELPLLEPLEPARDEAEVGEAGTGSSAAGEGPAGEPLESPVSQPDNALSDWVPVPGTVAEPTPGDDRVSAAGSVPTEGAGDWESDAAVEEPEPPRTRRYDYHDWLPPLAEESKADDASPKAAASPAQPEGRAETAAREGSAVDGAELVEAELVEAERIEYEAVESAEPVAFKPVEPEPPVPAEFAEPEGDEPRPALASETMADLYLEQGHVSLAVEVLRELVAVRPEDERLRARLVELEQQPVPPRETVRDMFARFARTSQPLRARGHPDVTRAATGAGQAAGPLADFFAHGAAPESRERPDALLAMLSPPEQGPPDEGALRRWLGGLRGS